MLAELHIENIAVIEKLTVLFERGLTVLTGETGAGKSIIIDSINMVLGERTSKELIRTGKNSAYVSAVFKDVGESAQKALSDFDFLYDDELIITRELSLDGKSAAKINGRPVNASVLKEIGKLLINIHGQHDSQALLIPEKHIEFVDAYGNISLDEYITIYNEISSVRARIKELQINEQEKIRTVEMLKYQINEIESAKLKQNEDNLLYERKTLIQNSEKYSKAVSEAYSCLYNGDTSAKDLIDNAAASLAGIISLSPQIDELYNHLLELSYNLDDNVEILRGMVSGLSFDENELNDIEQRLDIIYRLKKKYGSSIDDILAYLEKCKGELENLEQAEFKIDELKKQYGVLYEELKNKAAQITDLRKKASTKLEEKIIGELEFLDMKKVKFKVDIKPCIYNSNGGDEVEFLISANPGEEPKPLSKIASGGELSRIMLAMKSIFSKQDKVQTLIFDEIDTGVSGSASQKIGLKMKEISQGKQVICVTHLSQIAALANNHYKIEKHTEKDKTFTRIQALDYEGKIREIARIISGVDITKGALDTAKELLNNGMER